MMDIVPPEILEYRLSKGGRAEVSERFQRFPKASASLIWIRSLHTSFGLYTN